jgi:RNA polymerase-binding transcription factor DksA
MVVGLYGNEEGAMKKSKRTMRRVILRSMYHHLHEYYNIGLPEQEFTSGQMSLYQIDALLAFKTDPRLDELRSALDRLEDDVYGTCIRCKEGISQLALDDDPARRFCQECEKEYSTVHLGSYQSIPPL